MIPWRRAAPRDALRFDDGFIRYGPPSPPRPLRDIAPASLYVLAQGPGSDDDAFSYAQDGPRRQGEVAAYLGRAAAMEGRIRRLLAASDAPAAVERRYTTAAQDPFFMEPEAGLAWFEPGGGLLRLALATQSPVTTSGPSPACCTTIPACASPASRSSPVPRAVASGGATGARSRRTSRCWPSSRAARPCASPSTGSTSSRPASSGRPPRSGGACGWPPTGASSRSTPTSRFDAGGRANLCAYVASMAALSVGGAYRVPYAVARGSAASREVQAGSQRGFGGAEAALVVETLLDEAATRDGHDPIEVRRLSLLGRGDRTVAGAPIQEDLRLGELLDRAGAHPLWRGREAASASARAAGRRYGVGFAMALQAYGTSGDPVLAEVALDPTGAVTVRSNAVDMGNGSATTLGLAVAEALGANATAVALGDAALWAALDLTTTAPAGWADPRYVRKDTSSSSSCLTAFHQAHAARAAARVVFETGVVPAAARLWGRPRAEVASAGWRDGSLVAHGLTPIPRAALAREMHAGGGVTAPSSTPTTRPAGSRRTTRSRARRVAGR